MRAFRVSHVQILDGDFKRRSDRGAMQSGICFNVVPSVLNTMGHGLAESAFAALCRFALCAAAAEVLTTLYPTRAASGSATPVLVSCRARSRQLLFLAHFAACGSRKPEVR